MTDIIYIDGEEVQANSLETSLKQMAKDYSDGLMKKSDGNATHGAVVKLMDTAKNLRIKSISGKFKLMKYFPF